MLKAEKVSFFIFVFFLFIFLARVNYYIFRYLGIFKSLFKYYYKIPKLYIHKFLTTVPGIFITQITYSLPGWDVVQL